MNLRERVEDCAGRLVELDRTSHFERARQRFFGALQVAELHEDLSERRERDGEPMAGSERFVERDAALGQRQRLVEPMSHQGHVGLVVHDPGEHVVGLDCHREAFALTQGGRGLVVSARLGQQDRRERMHERQMATVACGVQRGRGLCQVVAHDARLPDLPVAMRELVMCEADCARIVCKFGVLERARVQRDGARLLAAGVGDAAVQPPECGQTRVADRLTDAAGWPAQSGGSLGEVVLHQPGFGQCASNRHFVLAAESRRPEQRRQDLGCF